MNKTKFNFEIENPSFSSELNSTHTPKPEISTTVSRTLRSVVSNPTVDAQSGSLEFQIQYAVAKAAFCVNQYNAEICSTFYRKEPYGATGMLNSKTQSKGSFH